jgi:hypothetical protein
MPAATYNIICDQGATLDRSLTLKDSAGSLANLTGFSAKMQVRTTASSSGVALELSTVNSRVILGGALGTVRLKVDAATTAALTAGDYVYDLEITAPNGDVTRLVEGKFKVKPEVTR